MVVQPSLPGRAKWASDLIERLEDSQRGIVRGIKTTGDMDLEIQYAGQMHNEARA